MSGDKCEIRTTSDGQAVRVNGRISQKRLDEMGAMVKGYVDSRCALDSDKPMPAIAQRMHGRENYSCGREKGHEGPHRWPDKPNGPYIVEWDAPTPDAVPSGEATDGTTPTKEAGS